MLDYEYLNINLRSPCRIRKSSISWTLVFTI